MVLRTPITVDHDRFRLPFALFFAFVVTSGLYKILELRERHDFIPVFIAVLIILGSLAPVVADGDLYDTHSDTSLYEQRPLLEPIFEFTTAKALQLETASEIVQTNSDGAASFRNIKKALSLHGLKEESDLDITNEGMYTEAELIVYHDRWPDHRHVIFGGDHHATVLVSEEWLEQTTATENKSHMVYLHPSAVYVL